MNSIRIVSVARSIPSRVVTNDDLSEIVDTNDEWIVSRTGIQRRHFLDEGQTSTQQAIEAARDALLRSEVPAEDICACIVATFLPDTFAPPMATFVHEALGLAPDAICFDMNGACAGFLYALHVARGLLLQHPGRKVLVVASEFISNILDFTDRSTCVLFGDGAGAVVVELVEGRRDWFVGGTQEGTDVITCLAHQGAHPGIAMRGQEVFRFACEAIERDILQLLDDSGLTLDQVDHVVCHQANARIINHVIRHLEADATKFYINVAEYGNTSAASIPIALSEMVDQGVLMRGEKVMAIGFGAGLVQGGVLLEW